MFYQWGMPVGWGCSLAQATRVWDFPKGQARGSWSPQNVLCDFG